MIMPICDPLADRPNAPNIGLSRFSRGNSALYALMPILSSLDSCQGQKVLMRTLLLPALHLKQPKMCISNKLSTDCKEKGLQSGAVGSIFALQQQPHMFGS